MSTLQGFSDFAFIEKPASGWLHKDDDLIDGNSITYTVQYIGVVSVLESINKWKQENRTELIREAIVRLADHAQIITANKKRKIPAKVKKALAAPNSQWGCECRLSINVDGFVIRHAVNKRELCKHPLNGVSFASGGEGPTLDFVAYVGKEDRTGRGCHIFQCPRRSHLVLLTMGQAFDLAARRWKGRKGAPLTVPANDGWATMQTRPSQPQAGNYEAPTVRRSMKQSDDGIYGNAAGEGDGVYDNCSRNEPADYDQFTPTASPYEVATHTSHKKGRQSGMFDDDIYEPLKGNMAHSKEGVYDNVPEVQEGGTTGKGRPQKGSGTDEDIYGGVDDGAEGVYDNAGGQRGMKFSDEGVYENPRSTGDDGHYDNVAGKGRTQKKKGGGVDEDIYGGLGEGGEGVYDNAGGVRGMKFSEEGVYENPHGTGADGFYDNVPGKGKPQKKKGGGSGVEEDIYGGLGEGGEGIYDNAGGGRGMKFSEEGVYETPHGTGQTGLYDNVPGKGKPQKKKGGGSGVEEDIYGGLGEGGEGIYDNAGGGRGMKFSEEGVYENPHGTGNEGLYDNPAMKRTPQGAMMGKDGMEEDIYGGVGEGDGSIYDDTTGGGRGMKHSEEGIYDNPNAKGKEGLYDNPAMKRTPQGAMKGKDGMEEDIYGGVGEGDGSIYDDTTGGRRGMKHSEEGIYDNPNAKGNEGLYDNPAMKRTPQGAMKGKDGMEEDIYGGVGEGDGSIYDDTTGGGRGMKHSEEGIYDNPNAKGNEGLYDNPAMKRTPQGAMKGKDGMEEDIYGGVGEGDGSIYDDTTGGGRGMKHSEEGIYDNPNAKEKEGIYDNPLMNRAPRAAVKAKSGMEEDVYGSVGEAQGDDGLYDDPKMVSKGGKMDFSDTGIYDNPHATNGQAADDGIYEGVPTDFLEKDNAGPEEGIYGGVSDVGGDSLYDNPHVVTGANAPGGKKEDIAFSGDGIYDNPEAVMQDDPLYDNKEGVMTKPEDRPGQVRKRPDFDRSIYERSSKTTGKGLQQGAKERWPLIHQSWFHGKVERIEAAALLEKDGDFLVRESKKKEGSYVLTAFVGKQVQHLVLVDAEGKVRAKDREFSSVAEMVYHFMDTKTPLFLGKTEVFLKRPIENIFPKASMDEDGESIYQTTE